MRPVGPDPAQRARDARLAWIIVGACALLTLALLVGGGFALRKPIGNWMEAAAANVAEPREPPAADNAGAFGKATPANAADSSADEPAAGDVLQKRDATRRERGAEDSAPREPAAPDEPEDDDAPAPLHRT